MSKSLWDSFQEAQTVFKALEKSGSVPDDVKWLCYGLGKQVTDGDFVGAVPPEANVVLMVKYKAWVKCKGKSADDAMREYIQEVDKLTLKGDQAQDNLVSPQRKSMNTTSPSKPVIRNAASSAIKEGTLFKQRDYVKAWRPRHFVLENNCLQYYVDTQDTNSAPRGSMDIAGCVVNHLKVAKVGENEFYPFTISKDKDSFVLASDSKVEADDWVDKIRMAATNALFLAVTSENSPARASSTIQSAKISPDYENSSGKSNSDIPLPMSPTETYEGLTPELKNKIERAVAMLVEAVDVNAPNWEPLFEKNGVSAFKRPGEQVCVRGDAILPFGIPAIFKLIVTASRACSINPQIVSSTNVRQISTNTNIQYLQFKQVWPTTARDFCNLTHWRILSDYRVLIFSTSHEAEEAPELSAFVRGELIIGGYVLTPTPTGTLIQYVVQSDLKGNIPKSVRNIVSSTQPLIVANIRKVLEEDAKRDESIASVPTNFTFQDLYNIKVATQVLPPASASSNSSANNDGVRQAVPNRTFPRSSSVNPKSRKEQRNITTVSLLVLLLPVVLYYVVDRSRRALAFFTGLVIALRYLFYLHLGDPYKRNSNYIYCSPPTGKYIIRFPVELSKLLPYLNGVRKDSGLDITMTHAVIKAVATVMSEQPGMNGYLLFGNYYPKKCSGVDISLAVDITEKDSVMMKLVDVDIKSLDYIADELQTRTKELKEGFKPNSKIADDSLKMKVIQRLPVFLAVEFDKLCKFIGNGLGLELPRLCIQPFAYGNCTIIAWPNHKLSLESDVDVTLQPDTASNSPITVTVGGIRTMSSLDQEKKLTGTTVLNIAIAIDSRMCSTIEARNFSTSIQNLLNSQSNIAATDNKKKK